MRIKILEKFPLLVPTFTYSLPSSEFAMDMKGSNAFNNIRQGNQRLSHLYRSNDTIKDEALALISQLLIMGNSSFFMGSFSSNIAIIVHDLGYGNMKSLMDINGRSYCGCGASFCMQMERNKNLKQSRMNILV